MREANLEEEDEDLVDDDIPQDFGSLMTRNGTGMKNSEIEEWTDQLLRADSNRELCRKCKEAGEETPYGSETGLVEAQPQFTKDGDPILDEAGYQLYVDFPELECEQGHRWYKGEGVRRNINGKNPILFESHLHNRRRREIYNAEGIPDPSIVSGIYNRFHPNGRKINSLDQRRRNGAGWYR